MTARILDGKRVASLVKDDVKKRVLEYQEKTGNTPALGTILVGSDEGSKKYVAGKQKDCAEVGIGSIGIELEEDASQCDILDAVRSLNENINCTGYIVQLPLPKHVSQDKVLLAIDPKKDADGLHPENLGLVALNTSKKLNVPLACTPIGIIRLLNEYDISLQGKHVVIIGRGVTAGRPLANIITRKDINATVTVTHSGTQNIQKFTREADVVVVAIGEKWFLKAGDIKEGCVVVDVGVSRYYDEEQGRYRVAGDCDKSVFDKASFVSPNPGGVGPMTRAMLLDNVMRIAERSAQ